MVVRFSADHRIVYANPSYCRYRGLSLEELRGTWVYADIAEVDREEAIRHYGALSRDRPASTIEHRAIGADGEPRWQQWTDRALARKAQQARPSLKLLLASGYEEEPVRSAAGVESAPIRLFKPYDSEQLAHTIRTILEAA